MNNPVKGVCLEQLKEEITLAQVTLNTFARQVSCHVAIYCYNFMIVCCEGQAHLLPYEAACASNKYHRLIT